VHPDRILRKGGARPGDVLVASKPLGTGLVLAGGTDDEQRAAIDGMKRLNRVASASLVELGGAVHAVTDVTGYGLAGHGWEIAERSGVRLVVDAEGLVGYPGAGRLAADGVRTGGHARNLAYVDGRFAVGPGREAAAAMCLDPQTSGGLLAAVDASVAHELLTERAHQGWWRVGEVVDDAPGLVLS